MRSFSFLGRGPLYLAGVLLRERHMKCIIVPLGKHAKNPGTVVVPGFLGV